MTRHKNHDEVGINRLFQKISDGNFYVFQRSLLIFQEQDVFFGKTTANGAGYKIAKDWASASAYFISGDLRVLIIGDTDYDRIALDVFVLKILFWLQ